MKVTFSSQELDHPNRTESVVTATLAPAAAQAPAGTVRMTIQVDLERVNGEPIEQAAALRWMAGCLNCNTNHMKATLTAQDVSRVGPEINAGDSDDDAGGETPAPAP